MRALAATQGESFVELLADPEVWIAFATLAALEIVLGIDNIIFISILVGRLPARQRELARRLGLALAMLARLALLGAIAWVVGLTEPWFTLLGMEFSGRDLILIGGGLFLLAKATHEIHNALEGEGQHAASVASASLAGVLAQIATILGNHGISLAAIIQKEPTCIDAVPLVMLTHDAQEKNLQTALRAALPEDIHPDEPVRTGPKARIAQSKEG